MSLSMYQYVLHVPGIGYDLACKLLCIIYVQDIAAETLLCIIYLRLLLRLLLATYCIDNRQLPDWKLSVVLATCNVYQRTFKSYQVTT